MCYFMLENVIELISDTFLHDFCDEIPDPEKLRRQTERRRLTLAAILASDIRSLNIVWLWPFELESESLNLDCKGENRSAS